MTLDPIFGLAIFCVAIAVIATIIRIVLFGKGVRVGSRLVELRESETEGKGTALTEGDVRALMASMHDVKHGLEEIEKTLNEIRDLLKSTA